MRFINVTFSVCLTRKKHLENHVPGMGVFCLGEERSDGGIEAVF